MDCSEVRAFGEEVSNEAIGILIPTAFPCVIGRGKEDLGLQEVGGFPMSGELFAVVVREGVDVVAQRVQPMHRGAVRGLGCWTGQFRNGREQAFALDMGEQGAVALRPDDGVALPVTEPRLGCDNRGALSDVDAMRDHASTGMLGTTPGIVLATPAQEPPEAAARARGVPDHSVDPFVAECHPTLGPQPKADLLRAPAFLPQLAGDRAPHTEGQLARRVSNRLLSGLRVALRLLKAVAPLPRVPGEFPAHGSLAQAARRADCGLGFSCRPQGVNLAPVFAGDPTICAHQ